MTNQQRAVQLLALSVRHIEVDLPSIYRAGEPGAETEAAVIRSLEYSLHLMMQAIELADEPTRLALAKRAAQIEAAIAGHRVELRAWLEVPTLIAEAEAERAVKH